jgi:hypothetical protein
VTLDTCQGLKPLAPSSRSSLSLLSAAADGEEDDVDHFTRARIEELVSQNKIVLFMKGNKYVSGNKLYTFEAASKA